MLKSYFVVITLIVIGFLFSLKNVDSKNYSLEGEVQSKDKEYYELQKLGLLGDDIIASNLIANAKRFSLNKISKLSKLKKDNPNRKLSAYDWNRRGPYHTGGRTRAAKFDIRDEKRILAAMSSGGVWLSEDAGDSWRKVSPADQNHSITDIIQDPRPGNQDTWYYSTGERIASRFRVGYGIFKSTDNGETWFHLESTVGDSRPFIHDDQFDLVYRMVIDHTQPIGTDIIYAATTFGSIMKTEDGGDTWNRDFGPNFFNNAQQYKDIVITESGVLYASISGALQNSGTGIFRKAPNEDWVNITPSNYNSVFNRIVFGVNPQNENSIYIFATTNGSGIRTTNSRGDSLWHSLWRYQYKLGNGASDGGNWEDLSNNLPNPEKIRHQVNSQGGYDMHIAVDPFDTNYVYIGAVNLYRSSSAWNDKEFDVIGGTCPGEDETCDYHYRYPNHHADLHNIFFSKNSSVMYTCSDGGLHKTNDNKSENVEWISLNNGLFSTQFYNIGIDHTDINNFNIVGGTQDNGSFYSNQRIVDHQWNEVLRADGFNCEIANNSEFIITSQNTSRQPKIKIWKSELDENGDVEKTRRIDPIGGEEFQWNTSLALDPNNSNIMYVAGGRILWRQNDLSKIELDGSKDSISIGWDSLPQTSIPNYNFDSPRSGNEITAVSVSTNPPNIVYYGTSNSNVYRIENANSNDPVVIDLRTNSFPTNGNVNSIAINPDNADEIILAFSDYGVKSLWHSLDGGDNWQNIEGSLGVDSRNPGDGPGVLWVEILPLDDGIIYLAGTTDGLFITSIINGEYTPWQLEAIESIGTAYIASIDTRKEDKYVAIGTYSTGIFDGFINETPPKPVSVNFEKENYSDIAKSEILTWESNIDAVYYRIQIVDENDELISEYFTNEDKIEIDGLEQGFKKYTARLQSLNAGGYSSEVSEASLETFLSITELIFPENNSEGTELNTSFVWKEIEGADSYRVQLNYFNSFDSPIIDTTVSSNSTLISQLVSNRNYFWRVAPIKNNKLGNFSDSFKTRTALLNNLELIDEQLIIYPNLVSDILQIQTEKPIEKIKIISSNGELKLNTNFKKKIDLSALGKGVYYIRLYTKKRIYTQKIIKI
ncbi:T9SS type A sorting domain-containing protein [Candidatus Kapabacteria bacterium]|nr:T9SS type A sorting domain-containing protein [Candidatus Kapabacteria bacterium]